MAGYTATMSNIGHYNQVNKFSGVTDASPHRLVQMLLEGVLGKLAVVKGMMSRGEVAKKGEIIGQAMAIVGGLRASLDLSAGGDLATNLDSLYEYIERRLLMANIKNDLDMVVEVAGLLHQIKTGWDGIPEQSRTKISAQIENA